MQQQKDINKLMKWSLGFSLLSRTIIYGLVMSEGTTLFLPSIFSPHKISFPLMQLHVVFCIKISLSVSRSILYTVIRLFLYDSELTPVFCLGCVIASDCPLADSSVFQDHVQLSLDTWLSCHFLFYHYKCLPSSNTILTFSGLSDRRWREDCGVISSEI